MTQSSKSPVERISVGLALTLLILFATLFTLSILKQYTIDPKPAYYSQFPITGKYISIDSVDTGFINNKQSNQFTPTVIIHLDPKSQQNGALRVFFRSNVGESIYKSQTVGDSYTFMIQNGTFMNGTRSMEIHCSQDLGTLSDFYGYKSQDTSRWVLKIQEAASSNTAFEYLTQAAIQPVVIND